MIDTHSHIYGPEFTDDIQDVVARAKEAGVEQILLPNINAETIRPMLDLCDAYPGYMHPMLGLHPTDVDAGYRSVLDGMEQMLAVPSHPYIAVGEVGLDFYWDATFRAEQIDAFCRQIDWAVKYQLPLMIHTRSAHADLVEIMERYKGKHLTGVFHCFGGTRDEAEQLLSYDGFALGIGGVLTYKKSTLPEALQAVPLDRVVLETDSPYLAPVPYRGKRNESAYVAEVFHKLSIIYNCPAETVEQTTTANVKRIFTRLK